MDFDSFVDEFDRARVGNNAPEGKSVRPTRKKFAIPPVKVACLECRASRTRCDGKPECSNCVTKGKVCSYTQSKRGGARVRKRRVPSAAGEEKSALCLDNKAFNQCTLSVMPELNQSSFAQPLGLVAPGGGLRQLDLSLDDADFIFDAIFSTRNDFQDSAYGTSDHTGTPLECDQPLSAIRVYSKDEDILGGYYTYIHPYFPVLPPPEPEQVTDNPEIGILQAPDAVFTSRTSPNFEPSSPLSLAISALLALIPHPDDLDPSGADSVRLRRAQAQAFAQSAFESIEVESELVESSIQPGEALSSEPEPLIRKPFHLQVPVELESIVALLLLSTYEYAQRGNIAKMRNRAGQALNAALNLGLHSKGEDEGYYAEANRRVWWMTYVTVVQGSILSNSQPPVLLYDPRFTTPGPTFAADPEAWGELLQAQRVIATATQFVIDLDITLKTNSGISIIWQRMLELEGIMEPLIAKVDTWKLESFPPVTLDKSELKVAQAQRGIARIKLNSARIKLHRYCAFSDVPVFNKRHCDLQSTSGSPVPGISSPVAPSCACSTSFHQISSPLNNSLSPTPVTSPGSPINCGILPFSSNFSAKVCLKSSFNIARSFQSLPLPQPIRSSDPMSLFPPLKDAKYPRMIPIFACCAMQSSYAMIMLCYKTRAMGFVGAVDDTLENPVIKLLAQLHDGVQLVVDALRNYSLAYEALGGMRDQIELAMESINTMQIDVMLDNQGSI